ncbi:MAG TPA: hypothetical protein VGV85_04480 [Longimicrobiaceae bacterium]|nr:hypothetical protein [Longimicrobiaceae bacterium]
MPEFNVDLTALAAIWMGGSVILVPLAGITARYGIRPLLDSVARLRAAGAPGESEALEGRFAALERGLDDLSRAVDRLAEESRHDRAAA